MQIEEFKKFASQPDAYKAICSKIAPSIFGHDDVKKAVACLLFGGSRKVYLELFDSLMLILFIYFITNLFVNTESARWCEVKR